jgi:hypothetical protein
VPVSISDRDLLDEEQVAVGLLRYAVAGPGTSTPGIRLSMSEGRSREPTAVTT